MAFDAFFLSAVLEEVRTRCIGAPFTLLTGQEPLIYTKRKE